MTEIGILIPDWNEERGRRPRTPERTPPRFPPHVWSVVSLMEDGPPRTNNLVESWHRRFETIVRKPHGSVFWLINELRLEDHRGAHELARLEAGHP